MNKNVPKLRFKEFDDEWITRKLGDVSRIIMGQSPSSSAYNELKNGIPLVQGNADITKRITTPRMYTSEITKKCEIEDIIMSVRAPVGSIAIANQICCIGRGVCSLKALEVSQKYLYQVLLDYENKWAKISQGSTFESINSNDIKGLILNLPSLQEQEKIANFFTILDSLIEEQDGKVSDLELYKKGMMQKIFSQEIRFKDENGCDYPAWTSKKIGEITKLTDGVHFTPEYVQEGIPFWSVETIVSRAEPKFITKEAHELAIKRCHPEKGDILMTRIGTLSKTLVINDNEELSIYVSVALIKNSKLFNSNYMKQYFDTEEYYKEFLSKSLLTATPKKINMEDLKCTIVKIPCLSEQIKIAEILTNIDILIEEEKKNLDDLREMKKGLLQQMFL